jgi:gentisate 1,2-dioxygenase
LRRSDQRGSVDADEGGFVEVDGRWLIGSQRPFLPPIPLRARRVTGSAVFCVAQGKGRTVIEGKPYDWSKGDILALPSWALHEHANTGNEDAILFSIHDRPVIEALGFYREEALAENGGHQHIS